MASVLPPVPTYKPSLPKSIIEKGEVSDAQLEAVVYAGQAHEKMLPAALDENGKPLNPRRRGFMIGDGTGVGKGREIAAVIMDNFNKGRTKAVWVSEKRSLIRDAKRDWKGIGGDPNLIFDVGKIKKAGSISATRGIAFLTYDTQKQGADDAARAARGGMVRGQKVRTPEGEGTISGKPRTSRGTVWYPVKLTTGAANEYKAGQLEAVGKAETVHSRLEQLVEWLGRDFDGAIALDEAHNLGNAITTKASRGWKEAAQKALAGVELQRMLPNARVFYVSATGATELANLAYAERLGLWGRGTPFPALKDFLSSLGQGGISAMELIARDLKALGLYIARNLSYDGVEYDRVEHALTPEQHEIYDELAGAWQLVLKNIDAALIQTGAAPQPGQHGPTDRRARTAALSAFWSSHQRFFNQIITSMQMPTVIEEIRKDLAAGRQVVLQLTSTNEAQTERTVAKAQKRGDDLEELDLTPSDQLLDYLSKSFPVVQLETYLDDNGNERTRPVMDSHGNVVLNAAAVAMRDQLMERVASMRVPSAPLDMILDTFGADAVAEVTGRKRRFIRKRDPKTGQMRRVEDSRGGSANAAEIDAFQDSKKKILVFSEAGGTGASYHADKKARSKDARRVHYLVQAGWRADKAVQGFGRTHRTNQTSAPIFRLVTTNLKGQKRFISSIARRLAQLGALTKGQRQAGDQGAFSAADNLESQEARDALRLFFYRLIGNAVPGVTVQEFEQQTGLNLTGPQGVGAARQPADHHAIPEPAAVDEGGPAEPDVRGVRGNPDWAYRPQGSRRDAGQGIVHDPRRRDRQGFRSGRLHRAGNRSHDQARQIDGQGPQSPEVVEGNQERSRHHQDGPVDQARQSLCSGPWPELDRAGRQGHPDICSPRPGRHRLLGKRQVRQQERVGGVAAGIGARIVGAGSRQDSGVPHLPAACDYRHDTAHLGPLRRQLHGNRQGPDRCGRTVSCSREESKGRNKPAA